MKSHKDSNVVTQTAVTHNNSETAVTHKDLEKKADYYPRRRENCFNSFFNWNIYDMVPVSINLIIPRMPNLFTFQDLKTTISDCQGAQECFLFFGLFYDLVVKVLSLQTNIKASKPRQITL